MSWFRFKSKKQFWLTLLLGNLVIGFFALLPILMAMGAGAIAESYGCVANEAGAHPCIMGGINYGGLIASMVVFGWMFLISMPLGAVGLLLWTIGSVKAFIFFKRATFYALADLNGPTKKGYAEIHATVCHQGIELPIRIFFLDRYEEQRFAKGAGTMIAGTLQETADHLILAKARVY